MIKRYTYNRYVIFLKYGIILFFFVVIFVFIFPEIKGWESNEEFLFDLVLYLFFFATIFPIIIWMTSIASACILIDEEGLTYSSVFKKIKVPWRNVVGVERRYYYSGTFPRGGPPRDIDILFNNNEKIKVYYFLKKDFLASNERSAIDELELDINKYTNSYGKDN